MAENPHYRDLLLALNASGVEYLVVGGYAVMKYTEPRFTKDLDLWVHNSPQNSAKLFQALAAFGAPLQHDGITPQTFAEDDVVYQIGVAPVRVDIMTAITGVQFADAWPRRVESTILGAPVHVISLRDLIANKNAIGRDSDLEHLKRMQDEA